MSEPPSPFTPDLPGPAPAEALLAGLPGVATQLAQAHSAGEVAVALLDAVQRILGARTARLWLLEQGELYLAAGRGGGAASPPPTALLSRPAPHFEDGHPEAPARAALPLRLDGQPLGLLELDRAGPGSFTPAERGFLTALATQGALALERAALAADLEARVVARTAELEAQRAALDAFVAYKEAVGGASDVLALARQAVQVVRANLAHVSAAYYQLEGGRWRALVWSDDLPAEVVAQITAGVPQDAPNFASAARSGQPLFVSGWQAEAEGLPSAAGYGAVAFLPVEGGQVQGLFTVGTREARAWSEREQALVRSVVRGLRVTLERTEHLRQLDEERAALAAFARFTEDSTRASDPLALAERASALLSSTLNVQVGYAELSGGRYVGRVFSSNTPPEHVAQARAGLPLDLSGLAEPLQAGRALFTDAPPAGAGLPGALALYPYFEGGAAHGLLSMRSLTAQAWSERERAMFRAVGRSLALAFERAATTRELQAQNAELAARARALEGLADLTRDLSLQTDEASLIRQAQAVALSLLPEGCALYYQPDGDRWRCRVQTGSLAPALQAAVDAGLPFAQTHNLLLPWQSGEPHYQDRYDQDTDGLGPLTETVGATATLPLSVGGQRVGVLAVALRQGRGWTATDRAVLETTARQLGLALEGAQAQRELSRTQHHLKVVAEHAPLLLFATDAQGVFTLSEGRLLERLGLRPGQAVGQAATALFAHEPQLSEGRRLGQALAGQPTHDLMHFETRGVTLETWFTPVLDAAGAVCEVVGVSLDVTERLEVQRQVERANEELRRSNAELEQFAYVASHDLQEPLRTVTSFAELLASKYSGQLDEKAEGYIQLITEGTTRMSQLLQDLLAFARVTRGAGQPQRVDSGEVVDQVRRDLAARIEEGGARLEVGPLPAVLGDPSQLRQLFQNLIGNALKFSAPGRTPLVRVSAEPGGEWWRFAVADNGIGIRAEFFERIFTIFQRLHTREKYEGNGIGLAITRRIVERHGGRLWLESEEGRGTTFYFTLPAAPDPAPPA